MNNIFAFLFRILLLTSVCLFILPADASPIQNKKSDSPDIQRPVPTKTRERLFYIQRTLNKNTIVYDANFDSQGNLNSKQPVKVYWIRFEEGGGTMPLRTYEQQFVFGVDAEQKSKGEFVVKVAAFKDRIVQLKQTAPFQAKAYTVINKQEAELDHIFVKADGYSVFSKVLYLELFGRKNNETQSIYERVPVNQ